MPGKRSEHAILTAVCLSSFISYSTSGFVKVRLAQLFFFTGKKDEQKDLPGSTIDGIIAGVICFLAVIVLIVAIVKQRRSRSRGLFATSVLLVQVLRFFLVTRS